MDSSLLYTSDAQMQQQQQGDPRSQYQVPPRLRTSQSSQTASTLESHGSQSRPLPPPPGLMKPPSNGRMPPPSFEMPFGAPPGLLPTQPVHYPAGGPPEGVAPVWIVQPPPAPMYGGGSQLPAAPPVNYGPPPGLVSRDSETSSGSSTSGPRTPDMTHLSPHARPFQPSAASLKKVRSQAQMAPASPSRHSSNRDYSLRMTEADWFLDDDETEVEDKTALGRAASMSRRGKST